MLDQTRNVLETPVKIYLVEYALFLWSSGLFTFVDQAHNKLQFIVNTIVCRTISGTYSTYGLLVAREELLSRELQEFGQSLNLEMIASFSANAIHIKTLYQMIVSLRDI